MRTPDRRPLDPLNLVLASVDAVRNLRALYVLLATFAAAGLLMAMAQASLARNAGLIVALQAGAALFVAFYGGNAAGILVMDDARGAPVRDVADAVRVSLLTTHRLLGALLTVGVGYAVLGGALWLLMWLCRTAVSGPWLGPALFALAVPAAVVVVGVGILAGVVVVVPLAAPSVWAGDTTVAVVRQLWRWMRHRLATIALLMAAVSLLTAGVTALVSFVVVAGGRVVGEFAVRVVGLDVSVPELMAGLLGHGAAGVAGSAHAAAARIGGGGVFALALVLPGLVYLRGTCSIYLAMAEISPGDRGGTAAEALI